MRDVFAREIEKIIRFVSVNFSYLIFILIILVIVLCVALTLEFSVDDPVYSTLLGTVHEPDTSFSEVRNVIVVSDSGEMVVRPVVVSGGSPEVCDAFFNVDGEYITVHVPRAQFFALTVGQVYRLTQSRNIFGMGIRWNID